MKRDNRKIIGEYLRGGISYRDLAKKYGLSHGTISKMVQKVLAREKQLSALAAERPAQKRIAPMCVAELRKELREAQLRNRLLETMIDIYWRQ